MARYTCSIKDSQGGVLAYLESEPEIDAMDESEDEISQEFSGEGFARFWAVCKREFALNDAAETVSVEDTATGEAYEHTKH